MFDRSILLILPAKPTASQIETAFVLKAVLKLNLGPNSRHKQFCSLHDNRSLGTDERPLLKSGLNNQANFSFSVVLKGVSFF